MIKITLEVKQEDIDKGIVKDCEKCPIALALIRTINSGLESIVVECPIRVRVNGVDYETVNDAMLNCFISAFDSGQEVKPFITVVEFNEVEWEPFDYD